MIDHGFCIQSSIEPVAHPLSSHQESGVGLGKAAKGNEGGSGLIELGFDNIEKGGGVPGHTVALSSFPLGTVSLLPSPVLQSAGCPRSPAPEPTAGGPAGCQLCNLHF